MKVGSLFSGIGGLDLGLERAGMTVAWQSEIDPYASKVLAKHWPQLPNHGDIKRIDWGAVEPVDVICGGYPCQPFSTAGKRQGEDDPRHLWPWVRDAISALRPRYAILENVRGHLSLGGLSVVGALAEIGYNCEWRLVSAVGMGAPHRRDRLIIVAYPHSDSKPVGTFNGQSFGMVAYPNKFRAQVSPERIFSSIEKSQCFTWWEIEPAVGRVADGVPHRVDRLRGLGNAVVPQVAEYIGRLVMAHASHSQH